MYRQEWTLRIFKDSSVPWLEPNGRRNNNCYYGIERKCSALKGMIATPLSFPLNNSNRWVWWMQPRRDAATLGWERTNWFSVAIEAFQAQTSDFQLILLNFLLANYKLCFIFSSKWPKKILIKWVGFPLSIVYIFVKTYSLTFSVGLPSDHNKCEYIFRLLWHGGYPVLYF